MNNLTNREKADKPKKIITYYQTHYNEDESFVNIAELVKKVPETTAVLLGAFHLVDPPKTIILNDNKPDDKRFEKVWNALEKVKQNGTLLMMMLGGYGIGSYYALEGLDGEKQYRILADTLKKYKFDGIDLDVEENMSLNGVVHLIDRLRNDFGDDFVIALAPVAPALYGGGNMSGFNYEDLYRLRGDEISWYAAQFYCGWGSLENETEYEKIINRGVLPANKVISGTITYPPTERGFVNPEKLYKTIKKLCEMYPNFGGMSTWEYIQSLPGGQKAPYELYAGFANAMGLR